MQPRSVGTLALTATVALIASQSLTSPCHGKEPTAVKNLLLNGGFEEVVDQKTGLPGGWEMEQDPPDAYKVEVIDGGRTGKKCLRIKGEGGKFQILVRQLEMNPDQRSVISGWIKCVDGDGVVSLMHRYRAPNGRKLSSTSIGGVSAKRPDWTHTAMIEHPEYTQQNATAEFIINGHGKVNALLDDLELFILGVTPGDLLWAAGDFESQYNGNLPPYLKKAIPAGGTLNTSLDDQHAANGRYCLKMVSTGEWTTATMMSIPFDATKVYTLTGKVRVGSGTAGIRIDYFTDDKRTDILGSSHTEFTKSNAWQTLTVDSGDNNFEKATHIAVTTVCKGDSAAYFDEFVLLAE